jgi:hypothetical protein
MTNIWHVTSEAAEFYDRLGSEAREGRMDTAVQLKWLILYVSQNDVLSLKKNYTHLHFFNT